MFQIINGSIDKCCCALSYLFQLNFVNKMLTSSYKNSRRSKRTIDENKAVQIKHCQNSFSDIFLLLLSKIVIERGELCFWVL